MKPQSLSTITLSGNTTPAQRQAAGGWAARHGKFEKGAVLPETQVPACPRVRVADFPDGFLKQNHIERLEQNQQIASCCRHPENHEVEARKTHPDEKAPDIYIFHCVAPTRRHAWVPLSGDPVRLVCEVCKLTAEPGNAWKEPNDCVQHPCGRKHIFFCVGATDDKRPMWDAA